MTFDEAWRLYETQARRAVRAAGPDMNDELLQDARLWVWLNLEAIQAWRDDPERSDEGEVFTALKRQLGNAAADYRNEAAGEPPRDGRQAVVFSLDAMLSLPSKRDLAPEDALAGMESVRYPGGTEAEFCDSAEVYVSRLVVSALSRLPDDTQEMIRLRFFGGWACKEIAEKFGLTSPAVSIRISKALDEIGREVASRVNIRTGKPGQPRRSGSQGYGGRA